jgi:hypothetical protein
MIEIARESLKEFANIEYVVSTFEAWPAVGAFRLVMAVQLGLEDAPIDHRRCSNFISQCFSSSTSIGQ